MAKPPSPNVRLTISVSPEVHATFQRMAEATGMSLSRAMGEWLEDTVEGAELLTSKLEQARSAPKLVVREMQAALTGMQDELHDLMTGLRNGTRTPPGTPSRGGSARHEPAAPEAPRPVIRGGKSSKKVPKGGKL